MNFEHPMGNSSKLYPVVICNGILVTKGYSVKPLQSYAIFFKFQRNAIKKITEKEFFWFFSRFEQGVRSFKHLGIDVENCRNPLPPCLPHTYYNIAMI